MRRLVALGLLAVALFLTVPALASADRLSGHAIGPSFPFGQGGYTHQVRFGRFLRELFGLGNKRSRRQPAGEQNPAPELDPTGVGSAAILLVGGSLVLMDCRRRARKRSNQSG